MKEIFKDYFIEPFREGTIGIIAGLTLWLTLILIVTGISVLSYQVIDTYNVEQKEGVGVVENKYYKSSYTTYTYSGKVMIPTHHPASNNVKVQIKNKIDVTKVDKSYYDKIQIGDSIKVNYKEGRLSKMLYILNIEN